LVDIVACNAGVTTTTTETQRSLREALKMRRALCGSWWTL
jgi:hypothetical protein